MGTKDKPLEPPADALAAWQQGTLTVRRAMEKFSLSRQMLYELCRSGRVRYRVLGGRGTRLLSVHDIEVFIDGLPGVVAENPAPEKGKGKK